MAALEKELNDFREAVPPEALHTCSARFLRFSVAHENPCKTIVATLHFVEGYPAKSLVSELDSHVVPHGVLRKLEDLLSEECSKLAAAPDGAPQALACWTLLRKVVEDNRLLTCTEDVAAIRKLLTGPNDSVKILPKAGVLKVSVEEVVGSTRWPLCFSVKVPERYPEEPLKVTALSGALPRTVTDMFFKQAEEISRRCAEGVKACQSVRDSDPSKPSDDVVRVATLAQVKHDINFFKEHEQYAANATNRKLRLKKKQFEHHEMKLEKQNEARRTQQQQSANANGSLVPRAVPSLLLVVEYLVVKFARLLPNAKCAFCHNLVLQGVEDFDGGNPPQRTYCGHWYHKTCLKEVMTNPPFGLRCPAEGCSSQVYHPEWTSDAKALEKQWALGEAHRREEEQLLDLMDLSRGLD